MKPYAIVTFASVQDDPGWAAVVRRLRQQHDGQTVVVESTLREAQPQLAALRPTYLAVIATPDLVTATLVREVSVLARTIDPSTPWVDVRWGIVTGPTASDAMRIVDTTEPLTVRRATSSTTMDPTPFQELFALDDGRVGDWTRRVGGGEVARGNVGDGSLAREWAEHLNTCEVDLIALSGHATQVNMEVPFGKGSIIASGGSLYMLESEEFQRWLTRVSPDAKAGAFWSADPAVAAARDAATEALAAIPLRPRPNPKVLVGAGTCYVGDALGRADSGIMSWLGAGGVTQAIGYCVPTWYGAAGWGTLHAWTASRGALTLSDAFYLTGQRIASRLHTIDPLLTEVVLSDAAMRCQTGIAHDHRDHPELAMANKLLSALPPDTQREAWGLLFDRDAVGLFGDPAWDARCDETTGPAVFGATWRQTGDSWTVDVRLGPRSGEPGDTTTVVVAPARSGLAVDGEGVGELVQRAAREVQPVFDFLEARARTCPELAVPSIPPELGLGPRCRRPEEQRGLAIEQHQHGIAGLVSGEVDVRAVSAETEVAVVVAYLGGPRRDDQQLTREARRQFSAPLLRPCGARGPLGRCFPRCPALGHEVRECFRRRHVVACLSLIVHSSPIGNSDAPIRSLGTSVSKQACDEQGC